MYDCAYCINRRSNDIKRATLSVSELEEITMEFYRRNYIEGLFLSSGVVRNPDYTMERLTAIARDLRTVHRFNGYIHLKSIPGCSQELLNEAGRYADRMSVNIEIPKEESLKLLAPEKDHKSVFTPMKLIQQGVLENKEDRKKYRHAPRFVPAGQSTQMIVGATKETDKDILSMSSMLYGQPSMRRVYYSGYISVNTYDPRLPILKQPPLVRENRLYQASMTCMPTSTWRLIPSSPGRSVIQKPSLWISTQLTTNSCYECQDSARSRLGSLSTHVASTA